MNMGWACVLAIAAFFGGCLFTIDATGRYLERGARAGVMVIDGTAYVLLPAKRGE